MEGAVSPRAIRSRLGMIRNKIVLEEFVVKVLA